MAYIKLARERRQALPAGLRHGISLIDPETLLQVPRRRIPRGRPGRQRRGLPPGARHRDRGSRRRDRPRDPLLRPLRRHCALHRAGLRGVRRRRRALGLALRLGASRPRRPLSPRGPRGGDRRRATRPRRRLPRPTARAEESSAGRRTSIPAGRGPGPSGRRGRPFRRGLFATSTRTGRLRTREGHARPRSDRHLLEGLRPRGASCRLGCRVRPTHREAAGGGAALLARHLLGRRRPRRAPLGRAAMEPS